MRSSASAMLSLGIIAAFLLTASNAAPSVARQRRSSAKYAALVVFGDSFSDNGNDFAYTNHAWPADPAYYQGRFSNGPVWAEHVAASLSVPLHDYAHGGATTSNALVQGFTGPKGTIPVPSLADQVAAYLSSPPAGAPIASSLFVLWGGANDILTNPNLTAAQSAGVLSGLVTTLRDAGAASFLLVNSPDLSLIPYDSYIVDVAARAALRDFSARLGEQLRLVAQGVGRATGASAKYVDLIPLFRSFAFYEQGWKAAGFDRFGLYGSCLVGAYAEEPRALCNDPDRHVFWDEFHPSKKTHALMAKTIGMAL